MGALMQGTALADTVLAVMALEALVVLVWSRLGDRGLDLAVGLLPGACLVLALREALLRADWRWIGLALGGALIAHAADLRRRLRRVAR